MNKYKNKSLFFGVLLLLSILKTLPIGLLTKKFLNRPIQSFYARTSQALPVHKLNTKNIHIFHHKDTKEPLSVDLHKQAYKQSLHHEFPTAPHYNKNYSPTTCETKDLKETLRKENPEIEVLWIPKTLYELFVMYEYENNYTEYTGYAGTFENSYFKPLLMINEDPKNINLHKQINDAIIIFLQQHPYQKKITLEEYFIHIAEKIMSKLPFKVKELKEEILNAIKQEYNNHKQNPETFLLYRSGPLDRRDFNAQANYALNHTKKEKPGLPQQISLSFGTGFFTAYYTDRGACAATMLSKIQKPYSYTLPINKKDISNDKSPFFVPPLGPIPSFFSSGEAFHARTKTAGYIAKPDGWCIEKKPFPKILSEKISINPLTKSTEQRTFYKNLYKNIIQKAIPLNKPTEHLIKNIQKQLPEE